MATSPDAFSRNFVPESNQIVAATRLLQARQSQKLVFDVPKETGEYPFVCTFPNHWRTMNGVMHVVDDLQLFLARNPIAEPVPVESRPFVRTWRAWVVVEVTCGASRCLRQRPVVSVTG
jgi:hypothetical protein